MRWLAWGVTLFAGVTMVTNVPFYSFKDINLEERAVLGGGRDRPSASSYRFPIAPGRCSGCRLRMRSPATCTALCVIGSRRAARLRIPPKSRP